MLNATTLPSYPHAHSFSGLLLPSTLLGHTWLGLRVVVINANTLPSYSFSGLLLPSTLLGHTWLGLRVVVLNANTLPSYSHS